jgi:hypothetical protein
LIARENFHFFGRFSNDLFVIITNEGDSCVKLDHPCGGSKSNSSQALAVIREDISRIPIYRILTDPTGVDGVLGQLPTPIRTLIFESGRRALWTPQEQ